jgi:hypothetical protein
MFESLAIMVLVAKKRRRNVIRRRPQRLPTFDEMQPLDIDVFNTAFNFAMNAYTGDAKVEDASKRGLNIVDDDGSVTEIRFTDIPMNRMMTALLERFGANSQCASATGRIWALLDLLRNDQLKDWVRKGDDASFVEIHPAVIDAAATVMMDSHGQFPLDDFLSKVKEIDQARYQDN